MKIHKAIIIIGITISAFLIAFGIGCLAKAPEMKDPEFEKVSQTTTNEDGSITYYVKDSDGRVYRITSNTVSITLMD